MFFAWSGTHVGQVRSGPDARFEMAVPPGEIVVQAHPLKPGEASSEAVTVKVADGETADVELVLGRR